MYLQCICTRQEQFILWVHCGIMMESNYFLQEWQKRGEAYEGKKSFDTFMSIINYISPIAVLSVFISYWIASRTILRRLLRKFMSIASNGSVVVTLDINISQILQDYEGIVCLEYDIMVNKARSSCKGTIRSVTACIVAFNPVLVSSWGEKCTAP